MNDKLQASPAFPKAVRTRPLLFLAVLAAVLAVASIGSAQDRRRVLRAPGLVLNTAAPVAACKVVQYTADGRFLVSAGEDKVVRIWPVIGGKLDRANARVLRWATWREQRGSIYAMDVYFDGQKPKLVAIGGMGLKSATIVILDFATGEVLYGLTEPQFDVSVTSLAFAPDGRRVAYGVYDGQVLEWDFSSDQPNSLKSLGQHLIKRNNQMVPSEGNQILAVHYSDTNTVLSVAAFGSVLQSTVNSTPPMLAALPLFGISDLRNVAVSGDGTRIAACGLDRSTQKSRGEFRTWDGTDGLEIPFPERSDPVAASLNHSGTRLAFSVNDMPEDATSGEPDTTRVVLFDTERRVWLRDDLPRPTNYVDAMAFDPAGEILAVAGGDDFEMSLWNLAQRVAHDSVRSRGSGLWGVGLSPDNNLLGFQIQRNLSPAHINDQGTGPWKVFDLESRSWIWTNPDRQREFERIIPLQSRSGWTVEISKRMNTVWEVVHLPSAKRFAIPLDQYRDRYPRCYTFLDPFDGAGLRIAVGHRFGISIFELFQNAPPRLVRRMIGHEGDVTAVAPSENGRILVSCSRDQTIAGWSLADWPNQAELGVDFIQKDGKLLVKTVAPGSPGWETGLTAGDRLVGLAAGGSWRDVIIDEFSSILKNPIPGLELVFEIERAGWDLPRILRPTTIKQRPLWRFFSTRDDEWVIWRWRDFFYDCSVRGDDLIGWQVNGQVDETPVFTRAEQYRRRFHMPEKVEEVLTKMAYSPESVAAPDLIAPGVKMQIEPQGDTGFNVMISTDVEGDLLAAEPNEVSLWVNDHRFKLWKNTPVPFTQTVWLPNEALRNSENRVIAQVFNEHGVRGESSEEPIHLPASQEAPRLFGLCVGIRKYGDVSEYDDLTFTVNDAEGVQKVLNAQADTGLYRAVPVVTSLLDAQATRSKIVEALEGIAQKVEPDDIFVLFMAGHGWAQRTAKNSVDEQSFVFVTADFDAEKDVETGLRFTLRSEEVGLREAKTLVELIADIRCRKLILLDCCHSGSIVGSSGDSMIRGLMPEGIGPAVIVACDKAESSWGLPAKGNGAFTQSVLEVFGDDPVEGEKAVFQKTDTNNDGAVSPDELVTRVRSRVPELIEIFRSRLKGSGLAEDQTQRPRSYIPDDIRALKAFAYGSE